MRIVSENIINILDGMTCANETISNSKIQNSITELYQTNAVNNAADYPVGSATNVPDYNIVDVQSQSSGKQLGLTSKGGSQP